MKDIFTLDPRPRVASSMLYQSNHQQKLVIYKPEQADGWKFTKEKPRIAITSLKKNNGDMRQLLQPAIKDFIKTVLLAKK